MTECGGDGLPPAGGAGLPAGGPGRTVAVAGAGAGSRLPCPALTALLHCSTAVTPRHAAHCLAGDCLAGDRLAGDRLTADSLAEVHLTADRLAGDCLAANRFPTAGLLRLSHMSRKEHQLNFC